MDKENALKLIKQVASVFKGTLQDHQQIQLAIKTLENLLNDSTRSESDPKDDTKNN